MMTVSAVARLIPSPPARVESRNTNCGALGAGIRRDRLTHSIPFTVLSPSSFPHSSPLSLTIESVDALLPLGTSNAAIDPLVLEAQVLQEVFEDVQHLGHLGENENAMAAFPKLMQHLLQHNQLATRSNQ